LLYHNFDKLIARLPEKELIMKTPIQEIFASIVTQTLKPRHLAIADKLKISIFISLDTFGLNCQNT